MGQHNDFGREGEQIAVDHLLKKGYKICERNYRFGKAEIDIIAKYGSSLAIVEVKSRTTAFLEDVAATIKQRKKQLLVEAANHYLLKQNLDIETRFDIITVIKKEEQYEVEHVENAFYFF